MAIKKNHSIPHTQGRLSQSVDFSGYIYPQPFTSVVNTVGRAYSDFYTNILSQALSGSGTLIGGVRNITRNFTREISEKRVLGNYETVQKIPGKINIELNLDKIQFYKDSNIFDNIIDINYGGGIKQIAPMMIVELLENPDGELKSIIYLDCWIKGDSVTYDLTNNILVVSKLSVDVARTFSPIDILHTSGNLGAKGLDSLGVDFERIGNTFDLNINF